MPRYDRTGRNVQTLKIGHVKCLRQELLHPGERINSSVVGRVTLGALREQENLPVHVHIEAFLTPLRWLQDNWNDYLVDGPGTTETLTTSAFPRSRGDYLGVGTVFKDDVVWDIWEKNYLRVYNEYFKWPESDDATTLAVGDSGVAPKYGLKAVNLPAWWTRFISQNTISDSEVEMITSQSGSREKFDIRDLSEKIARFRHEQEQEWMASGRYKEFIQTAYNAAGVNEVDQVPFSYGYARGEMAAQNLWATDGDNLGNIAGVFEFDVGHSWGSISSPEHAILSYFILLRSLPVLEHQSNPFLTLDDKTWQEIVGHGDLLGRSRPKKWKRKHIVQTIENNTQLGYAPAGQEWRIGWDNIDDDIEKRDSFLTMDRTALDNWNQHPDVDRAFRSTSLGHALINCKFSQPTQSIIPLPMSSVMTGG